MILKLQHELFALEKKEKVANRFVIKASWSLEQHLGAGFLSSHLQTSLHVLHDYLLTHSVLMLPWLLCWK